MKHLLCLSVVVTVVALMFAAVPLSHAQSPFALPLTVKDSTINVRVIPWGLHPSANPCIDSADNFFFPTYIGETEAPPMPPTPGPFEVRWVARYSPFTNDPGCFELGSYADYRPLIGPSQSDTFAVRFQPGDNVVTQDSIEVSWPAGLSGKAQSARLVDLVTWGTLINIDMLAQSSAKVADTYLGFGIIMTPSSGPIPGTLFLSVTPDSIFDENPLKPGKSKKIVKRVKPGKPIVMPNWTTLLSEAVAQGAFAPPNVNGSTESDSAGGMVIGVSYMNRLNPLDPLKPKWKPIKDSANIYAWGRITKWDFKKSLGKSYNHMQKTLRDKTGNHYFGTLPPGAGNARPRGLDSTGNGFPTIEKRKQLKKQFTKFAPKKHRNPLFAELMTLKFNIAASQLGKTPIGFGELVYDVDGNPFDEMSILAISEKADSSMTYWQGYDSLYYATLHGVVKQINEAFVGVLDTITWQADNKMTLKGQVDLATVPFLKQVPGPARVINPTTTETESPEELDFDDEEWEDMEENGVPVVAKTYQNFPNPFNPATTISFRLREYSIVTLKIYNVLGQEVGTLLDGEEMEDGIQQVQFVADGMASGVYFYVLNAQDVENGERTIQVHKMMLLK